MRHCRYIRADSEFKHDPDFKMWVVGNGLEKAYAMRQVTPDDLHTWDVEFVVMDGQGKIIRDPFDRNKPQYKTKRLRLKTPPEERWLTDK